jgi:hypothetical protein
MRCGSTAENRASGPRVLHQRSRPHIFYWGERFCIIDHHVIIRYEKYLRTTNICTVISQTLWRTVISQAGQLKGLDENRNRFGARGACDVSTQPDDGNQRGGNDSAYCCSLEDCSGEVYLAN